jgi:hypothetical protein
METTQNVECPICFEVVDLSINYVKTQCGHVFHCMCLMDHTGHNGYGCPLCRGRMVTIPEDDDEDEDDDEEYELYDDDALESFRMFHQNTSEQEIEEQTNNLNEENNSVEDDETEDDESEDEDKDIELNVDFIELKKYLKKKNISHKKLISGYLYLLIDADILPSNVREEGLFARDFRQSIGKIQSYMHNKHNNYIQYDHFENSSSM